MAGDWIPMRLDLDTCPEVVRILSAICPQRADKMRRTNEVVGALWRTWSLFDRHSDDGILDGYTSEDLNDAVGIEGWAENLQHVGWLLIEPQRLTMPGFESWLSQSSKRRMKEARRKQISRKKLSAKCPQRADKKRTTEEKRREENNNTPLPPKGDGRVADVIACYLELHPRAKPGQKERKLIAARLAERWTVEELCQAIDGCHKSPHHCGDNDRNQKYQSLSLIFRDSTHVQQFIEIATGEANGKPSYVPPSQRKSDPDLEQRRREYREMKAKGANGCTS